MTGQALDLRAIHDQIHNLVLSRRHSLAFWEGAFETAWAGYIIAHHWPENRQDEIVNSIKGELLGEKRVRSIAKPYDLAACYMAAAFLNHIGVVGAASDYVITAETYIKQVFATIEWQERFHFYSTPEYVYAATLAYNCFPALCTAESVANLQHATEIFRASRWQGRPYIFALAGTAELWLHGFEKSLGLELTNAAIQWNPDLTEEQISLLWFLEQNWERIRAEIGDGSELVQKVDKHLVELRTRTFRFFPNFILEPSYRESGQQLTFEEHPEHSSARVVSTIELLMLDEVAERHAVMSLVVTREEWARRDTITTLFDDYRRNVDRAIDRLGLTNRLDVVYSDLNSTNPASWSSAAFNCRQVLYELSEKLLQVDAKTYPWIPDKTGKPISLARDKEKNRLEAYLHQIGVRADNPLHVKHTQYLSEVIRALFDEAAATGKDRVGPSYEEAQSIVLNTYFVLGELNRLTEFQIVRALTPPSPIPSP